MSDSRKRSYAAAAFATLLILSVFWPSPIVSMNRLWLDRDLDVDELSFLGREAPSWDVVFWCLAGLLLLAIVRSAADDADPREPLRQLRAMHFDRSLFRRDAIRLAIGVIVTATVWLFLDAPLIAWAEGVQSEMTEDLARLLNRLAAG